MSEAHSSSKWMGQGKLSAEQLPNSNSDASAISRSDDNVRIIKMMPILWVACSCASPQAIKQPIECSTLQQLTQSRLKFDGRAEPFPVVDALKKEHLGGADATLVVFKDSARCIPDNTFKTALQAETCKLNGLTWRDKTSDERYLAIGLALADSDSLVAWVRVVERETKEESELWTWCQNVAGRREGSTWRFWPINSKTFANQEGSQLEESLRKIVTTGPTR